MSTTGTANILLIIADDLGADNVLVTDRSPERRIFVMTDAGGPMILGQLEYLSILLRNGLYFDQAWAQPVCSPTRGSLYTGTWPWRNGVGWPSSPQLDPVTVTALPQLLFGEGYQCGLFGKWHLGDTAGFWPVDHGWNRHIGTLEGSVNPNGRHKDGRYKPGWSASDWLGSMSGRISCSSAANGAVPRPRRRSAHLRRRSRSETPGVRLTIPFAPSHCKRLTAEAPGASMGHDEYRDLAAEPVMSVAQIAAAIG
jgi:arylsulfatase A-like enzyme